MVERVSQKLRTRRNAGFTLLEMLVAITLMALIATLLAGTLRFGVRVWETGERAATEAKVAAVQRLLYQWLNETEQTRMPTDGADMLSGVFEGSGRALRFLDIRKGLGQPGGYYLNELYLDEDEEGDQALMLRRRLVQPGVRGLTEVTPEAGGGETRILLDHVAEFEIAYFGRATPGSEPEWLDEWRERLDLPLLVELRLRFPDGDRRRWPDMTVPLERADG